MPTSQLSPLDPSNVPSRRVPKLTVRSRSDETAISDVSQSSDSNNESGLLRVRTTLSPDPALRYPSDAQDDRSRHGSSGSQGYERPHRHQANKKKSNGVLGFLTLKEPSTSALEEFAEHEKRKAAQKGSKSIAMVMPGVSSQKLPDHVPKVNSKWDGLPEAAKKKHTERKERETASPIDLKHFSLGRSASGRAAATSRPYGSLSSKPSIRRSQDKKRLAIEVTEVEEQTQSPPLPNTIHPAFRRSSMAPSPLPPDELELPDLSGYTTTSPAASPRTPTLATAMPVQSPYASVKATTAVAPWLADDDVIVKSAGPNVLSPPKNYHSVAAPVQSPQSPRTLNIPTFSYSATPASSDRLMPLPSPAASTSSGSSEMSAQWKSPPKERLSMGPQIKKQEVLPWEMFDAPPEESDRDHRRSSVADANKLKRFSYRLGRK